MPMKLRSSQHVFALPHCRYNLYIYITSFYVVCSMMRISLIGSCLFYVIYDGVCLSFNDLT